MCIKKAAIIRYTGPDSYILNDTLRRGLELTAKQTKWIKDLNSALDKLPKFEGLVQRSLSFHDSEILLDFLKEHQIDKVITYDSFTSASKKVYNKDDDIRLLIHSKNGSDLKGYNDSEYEVLYRTNSKFRVSDILFVDGKLTIEMEEYHG